MARWNKITITGNPTAQDTDGFANDVAAATPGTTLFVLAATSVGDSLAHKVIITPSASVTGSYVITGTDANGQSQTETLATDTTNAVTSAKYYLTLVSVKSPSGLSTNTVDIGWTNAVVSSWVKVGPFTGVGMAFGCVKNSGSPTYGVEYCFADRTAYAHADVAGETTSQAGTILTPVEAVRLIWSAVGEVTLHGLY